MNEIDMREASSKPIILENQILILGNPVIPVSTMQELTNRLDELGLNQPIVIVNPSANTVPDFDKMLSNLIQNNRKHPEVNVTTEDKYRFKDMTDIDLRNEVNSAISADPTIEFESLFDIYQGLRARAQALFSLDSLQHERDQLWSYHCANPNSPDGQNRFMEIVYRLIPQAQQYYQWVCNRLASLEVKRVVSVNSIEVKVEEVVDNVSEKEVKEQAVSEVPVPIVESEGSIPKYHRLWGPWNNILIMQMPIEYARDKVDPCYPGLKEQQHDVQVGDKIYYAVEPEVLLALGISIYRDGVPVVYSSLGTFLRIGESDRSIADLEYWYPKPKPRRW